MYKNMHMRACSICLSVLTSARCPSILSVVKPQSNDFGVRRPTIGIKRAQFESGARAQAQVRNADSRNRCANGSGNGGIVHPQTRHVELEVLV